MKKRRFLALLVFLTLPVHAEKASVISVSAGYSGYSGDVVDAFESIGGEIEGGFTYGIEYVAIEKGGLGFSIGFQNIPYESTLGGVTAESDWRHFIVGALYGLNSQQSNVYPYIGVEYHAITSSDLEFSGCGSSSQVCDGFNSISQSNDDIGGSFGAVLGTYILGAQKDVSYGLGIRVISADSGETLIYQGFANVGISF